MEETKEGTEVVYMNTSLAFEDIASQIILSFDHTIFSNKLTFDATTK